MARIGVCFSILALILFHEILLCDGRDLMLQKIKDRSKSPLHGNSNLVKTRRDDGNHYHTTSKMSYVEDFRPTSPGHSPGVGHFLVVVHPHHITKKFTYVQDFKPTSPGHSPGVGHSQVWNHHHATRKVIDVQDFQPTSPGHSPGVGHGLRQYRVTKKAINVEDTSPGHNPGGPHS